jgi:hypothetical protein
VSSRESPERLAVMRAVVALAYLATLVSVSAAMK